MEFFHLGDLLKRTRHLGKTFAFGGLGKIRVKRGPLQVLSGRRLFKIKAALPDMLMMKKGAAPT